MVSEEITQLRADQARQQTAQQIANHVQQELERLRDMVEDGRSDYLHGRIEALYLAKNWLVETFDVR